jgi:hypothetical protein
LDKENERMYAEFKEWDRYKWRKNLSVSPSSHHTTGGTAGCGHGVWRGRIDPVSPLPNNHRTNRVAGSRLLPQPWHGGASISDSGASPLPVGVRLPRPRHYGSMHP